MLNLRRVFAYRLIDDWRDRQILTAANLLNQVAVDLKASVENDIRNAGWIDSLISIERFISEKISPKVREMTEPVVAMLIQEANAQLIEIVDHQVDWVFPGVTSTTKISSFESIKDIAMAAGPLGSGVALGTALPSMAVTTTGGLLGTGFLATTVISWPVVVVGGAAVALAVATGVLNVARIGDKATSRLQDQVARHIHQMLIHNDKNSFAILQQLAAVYSETAKSARKI